MEIEPYKPFMVRLKPTTREMLDKAAEDQRRSRAIIIDELIRTHLSSRYSDVHQRIERLLAGDAAASEAAEPAIEESIDPEEPVASEDSHAPQSSAPPAALPPPLPAAGASGSETRTFEFVGGSSRKFWEVTLVGATLTVRFGRIGTIGQSQSKTLADSEKARDELGKLIAEKIKKGYTERTG